MISNSFFQYLPDPELHFIVKEARQIENSSNCIGLIVAIFPSLELECKKRRFDFSAKVWEGKYNGIL